MPDPTPAASAPAKGARRRYGAVSSSLIVIGMRWTDRLLGLISTLVLARLLVPEDFGVVAMASMVVGLIDVMMSLGVNAALIHDREATADDYSTAWTLRLLEATLAGTTIVLVAPLAANYFDDPRVVDVMRVMGLAVAIAGLENIGLVSFQKDMQFGSDFAFFFRRRVIAFVVTLALAWWFRTYWAMVIGALVGKVSGVVLSYLMHEMRPRLTLTKLRKIWAFSQMMLLRGIGNYLGLWIDKLVLGGRVPADIVGGYRLADEVASMPTTEVLAPLGRVLFPAFVESRDDPQTLRHEFLLAFAIQLGVVLPAAVGLALVADLAIPVLLGAKWTFAVPFIRWLAIGQLAIALMHAGGYLLLAMGRVGTLAAVSWLQVLLFAVMAILVFEGADAVRIAQLRLAATVLCTPLLLIMLLGALRGLTPRHLAGAVWRPVLACATMTAVLLRVDTSALSTAPALVLEVALGAAVYTLTGLIAWVLAGRPPGVESWLAEKLGLRRRLPWLFASTSRGEK